MLKRQSLEELLISKKLINEALLQECVLRSSMNNRRLEEVILENGIVEKDALYQVLEEYYGVPYIDLDVSDVDYEAIGLLNAELARRSNLVPVKKTGNVLYVAIEDPRNFRALDDVRTVTRMDVHPMLANGDSISRYIERAYSSDVAQKAISEYSREIEDTGKQDTTESLEMELNSSPIVRLVNNILEQAVNLGASDIHVEPLQHEVRVRMRVDGVLTKVLSAPANTLNALAARIKILGGLNIAERRAPQDGRFHIRVMNRDIDIRLSVLPTTFGEKAVMRLLDRSSFLIPKSKLGFTESNLEKFDSMLSTPHGIILVTGPTGSGKSTTLYTMLSEINDESDNIMTVEDPVEYMMEGLNQVQVNDRAGVSFASALRALLRQDPDVIMLGEIRDEETVEIAIRAAITGHLVLSTIHTNDALSTVLRLQDMGVPMYLIAASVVGIISQRLVRVICSSCKEPCEPPTAIELETVGMNMSDIAGITFYKGKGCAICHQRGYKGRMAVHEIVIINHILRELIHKKASMEELQRAACEQGMVTLRDSALELLRKGLTTLEEISTILHGV